MNALEFFLRNSYTKWEKRSYLHQTDNGKELTETFGSFIEKVNYLGAYLNDRGFSGKNIGIYSPNSIKWMITDIAVMNYVGVSVGLSKEWKYDDLVYALKKCDISCLFYSEVYADIISRAKANFLEIVFISFENDFDGCINEGKEILHGLFSMDVKTDDEPAKIVLTSGSTSFPKAVLLSIRNIFSGCKALGKRAPLDESDVCYLFLPLSHTYGSIYNFIYSLVFGFSIYLAESIKTMAQEMCSIKPTVFSGVPIVYIKFSEASAQLGVPIKALLGGRIKYLFCGGAKLAPEVRQQYVDGGMYLMNAYALSETASAFSIDYPECDDFESVGTLFEELDVKVISPDESGFGELAVKGDNVFLGYYNDSEATRLAFDGDGYFLTGDIGCVKDNKVYIRGRKDTMLTLPNGENISSAAISEKIKLIHPLVRSVKLYVRDSTLTADIYAAISDEQSEINWDNLIEKLNDSLPKYERIARYNIIDAGVLLK